MSTTSQVDRTAVLNVVRVISSRYLPMRPGEESFLDAAAPALIDSYIESGPGAVERNLRSNAFEWGPTVPADLAWIPVLLGTLKAGMELWKSIAENRAKQPDLQEISSKWKERLVEAGVDPALANTIATEMSSDFVKTAAK
jgi:hypothetical protein